MIARLHYRTLQYLFGASALIVAAAMLLIIYDVLARNLGFQPFPHTLALTEYGLFCMTMLGAPWLARHHQHIFIQLVIGLVRPRWRVWIGRVALLIAALVCLTLAGYGAAVSHELYLRGDVEVRSFDMPRWLVFAALTVSFTLLTFEFLRLLPRTEAMYDNHLRIRE